MFSAKFKQEQKKIVSGFLEQLVYGYWKILLSLIICVK